MKDVLFAILKILVFLLILPLIAASCLSFKDQIFLLPAKKEIWLFWGAGAYVALNLFVYDFKNIYVFGKSWIDKVLTFFKPAGYVIPVYSLALIVVYAVFSLLGRAGSVQPYFLFAIAFTLAMHLVLTAHEIYESDSSLLKAHYLITFGAVLIVNLIIISLLFAWAISEYSLIGFIKSLASQTSHLYKLIYKIFFIDSSV